MRVPEMEVPPQISPPLASPFLSMLPRPLFARKRIGGKARRAHPRTGSRAHGQPLAAGLWRARGIPPDAGEDAATELERRERELVGKIMGKLRAEVQTIEESDWMFEPVKATR
jgi:hypothetical protein